MRASRRAEQLSKLSASVPCIPGLAGPGGALIPPPSKPAGTEGRLQRTALVKAKLRKREASRAYAPRIGKPQM